jgi:hypothetical protein
MSKPKKYTDEQLIQAVKDSGSIRQVLQKINLREAGGNYESTKQRIATLNLDTSHFHGMKWNKGKTLPKRNPIESYLINGKLVQSNKLKLRLISEGLKSHKCEMCGLTKWNGLPAPIELDHIDGNRYNNQIENLRILCPNCHAQTDTYRGKNKNRS